MNKLRRQFLRSMALGAAAAGSLAALHPTVVEAAGELDGQPIAYGGTNLDGWSTVVGDGLYVAPGEAPVDSADLATRHNDDYSELQANVTQRRVEAHNITHQSVIDTQAMAYLHRLEYEFRVPYIPTQAYPDGLNAQTIEGGLGLWDGQTTRQKYGIGFQWGLNPWSGFGDLRVWTGSSASGWVKIARLEPDTEWHKLRIIANYRDQIASLTLDGKVLPACIGVCPAPAGWGTEVSIGPSAEIISIYPGPTGRGGKHLGQFRNWVWVWEPLSTATIFLPSVQR
ncbi:MAG: hypothetical protein IPK16_03365 [Anaerolineales bacterium]|nr:hypothetical protein [Anaerolineales bacterium]